MLNHVLRRVTYITDVLSQSPRPHILVVGAIDRIKEVSSLKKFKSLIINKSLTDKMRRKVTYHHPD